MLQYLNQSDWQEIAKKHPQAVAEIERLSLHREHDHLVQVSSPTDWQWRRLCELRQLFNLPPMERIRFREYEHDVLG